MEKNQKQVVADIAPVVLSTWGKKPVNQYEISGKFVKSFESVSEASRQTGIKALAISRASNGKLKSAGHFQWRKAE
jgi:hypothetical protein